MCWHILFRSISCLRYYLQGAGWAEIGPNPAGFSQGGVNFDVSWLIGSDSNKDVWVMLPPIHCDFSSFKESSYGNSELFLMKLTPSKVGIPCGLISSSRLGKIFSRYHISPNCRVPNSNEFVSTLDPLEVTFCKEAFNVGLRILLHLFIARFLQKYGFVSTQIHSNA